MDSFISKISGKTFPATEQISCQLVSPSIFQLMREDMPTLQREDVISLVERTHYKQKYVERFILKEIGEINALENEVIDSIDSSKLISKQTDEQEITLTLGQKLADKIANFGGSWYFILSFFAFITLWLFTNILLLQSKAFDAYPFILLNLILSCVAAMQAPVIMMSQNRQEEKDRLRAKKDYLVNLKTELEIRILHEKLDYLLDTQHIQTTLLKNIQANQK